MSTGNRHSVGRKTSKFWIPKFSLSAALLAMLAGTTAVGTSGCALPLLGVIPSVVGLLFDVSTSKKDDTATAAKDGDVQVTTGLNDNDSNSSKGKMTPAMDCHLLALARPDLTVVELRKGAAGAPEYRELHLEQSTDDASWNPVVDSETGPSGWRPAVNFLSMDFKPALTDVIPDTGTCYLAYAPIGDSNTPSQVAELKAAPGDASGDFAWAGRTYQYRVARTLPCTSPSAEQSAAR
jgi:hypothetical protein